MHPSVRLRAIEQRARRRFGQNFLIDPDACGRIARAAGAAPGVRVLEIGPGLGALTDALLATGAEVTAIELDRDLAEALRESHPAVRLVQGDALRVSFDDVCPGEGWHVAANLPYNVGTHILVRLLREGRFRRMALMLQREVADRVLAGAGEDAVGALSMQIQARAAVLRVLTLPPGAFHPAPKVHSSVIRVEPYAAPDFGVGVSAAQFDRVVRAGYSLRRKKLPNALQATFGRDVAVAALVRAGVSPDARAETLNLDAWRRLAAELPGAGDGSAGVTDGPELENGEVDPLA